MTKLKDSKREEYKDKIKAKIDNLCDSDLICFGNVIGVNVVLVGEDFVCLPVVEMGRL